jgi:hypothetical protein
MRKKVILPNPKRKASPLNGVTLSSLARAVKRAVSSKETHLDLVKNNLKKE